MGEIRDAQSTEGELVQTHIGGQALIEGIMMRGRYNWAVAIRQPDGTIHSEQHDLVSGRDGNDWMHKPIIRGCTALVESLVLGFQALEISADYAYDFSDEVDDEDEGQSAGGNEGSGAPAAVRTDSSEPVADVVAEEASLRPPASCEAPLAPPSPRRPRAVLTSSAVADADPGVEGVPTCRSTRQPEPGSESEQDPEPEGFGAGAMALSMTLGVVVALALFIALPAFVANLLVGDMGEHAFVWNLTEGLVRIAVFILYLWGISFMKDISRMFSYHGAEHKTIHCYEHGRPLTPEEAQGFSRLHVRCGTAFLIITLIIALLFFALLPVASFADALGVQNPLARFGIIVASRIVFLPLVAGLSYEVCVRWAGSHPDNPLVRVVLWPGMQMQRLTTRQPDDDMIECAIVALELVLERERAESRERGIEPKGLVPSHDLQGIPAGSSLIDGGEL